MSLQSILSAIESSQIAALVRADASGNPWIFPIIETCHVGALAVVYGSIAMLDLRLLGLTARETRISRLTAEVLPWTWIAWGLAAASGTLMFVSKATTYAGIVQFRVKFLCMALAGVNMLVFHRGVFKRVAAWDCGEPVRAAKLAGGLSLLFWTGVVFFGRWTGFAI